MYIFILTFFKCVGFVLRTTLHFLNGFGTIIKKLQYIICYDMFKDVFINFEVVKKAQIYTDKVFETNFTQTFACTVLLKMFRMASWFKFNLLTIVLLCHLGFKVALTTSKNALCLFKNQCFWHNSVTIQTLTLWFPQ